MPTPNITLAEPIPRGDAYTAVPVLGYHESVVAEEVHIDWAFGWKDPESGEVTADPATKARATFGADGRSAMATITLQSLIDAGLTTFGEAKDYVLQYALLGKLVAAGAIPGGTIE